MNTTKKRGPKQLSDEHKKALAEGRMEGRYVANYLNALRADKLVRRPGRKRTIETIERQIMAADSVINNPDSDVVEHLEAVQKKMSLFEEMESLVNRLNPKDFEADFIAVAKNYSERRGITYAAWRSVGVEASVLKKAGIRRSS